MPIITLTTDFGLKDPSVAALKGAILSELGDEARLVDISHQVSPFHLTEAAYIIKKAYQSFPAGSIHIIGVDAELTPENKHLCLKIDGHFLICADNGISSLIAEEINPEEIVEINIHQNTQVKFPVLDIFVKVASHLARGGKIEVIGKKRDSIKRLKTVMPIQDKEQSKLIGHVMYIDNYGNVITNISEEIFENFGKGRAFTIQARSVKFKQVHQKYSEAINFENPPERRQDSGKKLALFNSSNFLELAIYKSNPKTVGSAATLFGLEVMDSVTVNFK
jgi:hypothetical protein